ncbi:MAG: glycosyltransferase [Rhizobiaceae bacterium]
MAEPPVILFYVQHLLGIGHVFRATRIARELVKRGALVHMAWGGTRLPSIALEGLAMTFLEPVRVSGADFQNLVQEDGSPVDEDFKASRRDALLDLLDKVRPKMVVTEAYPFGRRQMRFELEPLMQAAHAMNPRPFAVSSIRDIMTENRAPKRVRESIDTFKAWFDLLIVHGDPDLVRIEDTLQGADEILDKVVYGGIVTPDAPDMSVPPSIDADVVVSAGGGAVGHALTAAAIGAMRHCKAFPGKWLLVVGPERPAEDTEKLGQMAEPGMQVVRFVPDLARVIAGAKVSVSRSGYNTVGDLLRARTRSVLVPFAGGRETEQLRRAEMLAAKGIVTMMRDEELTPQTLAAAVDRAASLPALDAAFRLEGAAQAADILLERLADFSSRSSGKA